MDGRDTSPLGIPKSPSFHSGLDLVASASVGSFVDLQISGASSDNKNPFELEGTTNSSYLHNFTLTLRKDKSNVRSPNSGGSGKSDMSYYDGVLLQRNNEVERVMQMQGQLPRLAGTFSVCPEIFFFECHNDL